MNDLVSATPSKRRHFEKAVEQAMIRVKMDHPRFVDYGSNVFYFDDANSNVVLLPIIDVGTDQDQRTGKRVNLKSVHIHGVAYTGTAAPVNPLYCLLMIVYDRDPTGIFPTVDEILVGPSPVAHSNDVNANRFRVMMRRTYALSFTIQVPLPVEEFIDLQGLSTVYDGDTSAASGGIAHIKEGALYLIHCGYEPTAFPPPAAAARCHLSIRVRYIIPPQ